MTQEQINELRKLAEAAMAKAQEQVDFPAQANPELARAASLQIDPLRGAGERRRDGGAHVRRRDRDAADAEGAGRLQRDRAGRDLVDRKSVV